jgi:hypothetical protein
MQGKSSYTRYNILHNGSNFGKMHTGLNWEHESQREMGSITIIKLVMNKGRIFGKLLQQMCSNCLVKLTKGTQG